MAGRAYHRRGRGSRARRARAILRAALHPILFRIGSYEVPAYGVALTLAFAFGILIARRRARAVGIDEERVIDACLIALATSLLGARLLWVATHPEVFAGPEAGWLDAINPFGAGRVGFAGLSMMGGVVMATASGLAYLAWRGLPLLRTVDLMMPSALLGEGITRIGCFLNGCCYGHPCDGWFCVAFPPGSGAHASFGDVAVHPTQLYASALGFAGFFALSALWRARPAPGTVFFAFLVWIGAQRVLLDALRFHDPGTIWLHVGAFGLPSSTLLSAGLAAAGLAGLAWCAARARGHADTPA
jgi:phosphatidylglycerol:prolipoprotein diacylglycerol transferase